MLQLAWRGVRHNPARYVATLVAILTGVAFFTATGFLSDRVIGALEGDVDRQYGNVDVAVIAERQGRGCGLRRQAADPGRVRPTRSRPPRASRRPAASSPARSRSSARTARSSATAPPAGSGSRTPSSTRSTSTRAARPAAAGEIAVDKGLAGKHDLTVGQKVTVLTLAGPQQATVVGITKFGEHRRDRRQRHGLDPQGDRLRLALGRAGRVPELYVRGGGDQKELAAAIDPRPGRLQGAGRRELPRRQARRDRRAGRVPEEGPAGVRDPRPARRRVRHLQHLQRDRRPAPARARGAVRHRGDAQADQALAALRGRRDRRPRARCSGCWSASRSRSCSSSCSPRSASTCPGAARSGSTNVVSAVLIGTVITVASVMIPARRAARTEPIEALRDAAVEAPLSRAGRVIASVSSSGRRRSGSARRQRRDPRGRRPRAVRRRDRRRAVHRRRRRQAAPPGHVALRAGRAARRRQHRAATPSAPRRPQTRC